MTAPNITRLKLPAFRAYVESQPWAIEQRRGMKMLEALELHAQGGSFSPEYLAALQAERAERLARAGDRRPITKEGGAIAVIPVYGPIAQRMDMMMQYCGGASAERIADEFDAAMRDPEVSAIVFDCDSPGGSVQGTPELAARIFAARGKGKRLIAVSNGCMASAAYWICSACDEIVASPSSDTGSIGVFTVHADQSALNEKIGIKYTLIKYGEHKAEENPWEPLPAEAQAFIQGQVDDLGEMFEATVAKHRGRTAKEIAENFGQGRCLSAKQALAIGMIDRVATLEDTLKSLGAKDVGMSGRPPRASATRTVRADDAPPEETGNDEQLCPDCGATMVDGVCPDCGYTEPESIPTNDEGPEARGRARDGDAVPPATSPAHQARSSTMSDKDTAAERAALMKAESHRQHEIRTLCAENKISDEQRDKWINDMTDVGVVSSAILQAKRSEASAAPGTRSVGAGIASLTNLRSRAEDDPRRGFASHRDFALAVIENAGLRNVADVSDERLRPLALFDKDDKQAAGELAFVMPRAFNPRTFQAAAGSDEQGGYADRFGGFLSPTQIMPGLLSTPFDGDPTAGMTQPVPMGAPVVTFNARTDKDHTTSVSGGFTVTRRPETVAGNASRMETEEITLKASSLFGLAFATEEILTDSPISFAALIDSGFRDQFPAAILNEKIRGAGGTEFLGVKNSPAKIAIAKEVGQTADTIVYNNVINMASQSWGFGQAVWMANHDCRPQLSVLSIPVGTGGTLIYQPSPGAGFPDMLLGRPVIYNEFCDTIGDEGDLMLVNWSQYLEGLYQPLQSAESVHVRFVNHERAFKLWVRNAGAPWWRAALTPAKSTKKLSPIVTLAAR